MASPSNAGIATSGIPGPLPDAANFAPADIARVVEANVEAALERFNDRTLIAAGKVNLISLDAIRMRLGGRWLLRQEQVYDFASRAIERTIGMRGLHLRVSETDFVVVQPDLSRLAAQAACLRCLREVLHYFLGEASLAGKGVLQVTRIGPDGLTARPMEPGAEEMADQTDDEAPADVDPPPPSPPDSQAATPKAKRHRTPVAKGLAQAAQRSAKPLVDTWSPFLANDGLQLRVSAVLEPVYELRGFTRIGFRMVRRVLVTRTERVLTAAEVSKLSAADQLRIDLATIARGVDRLSLAGAAEQHLSLIIPLSYVSLSSTRGRALLVSPLQQAAQMLSCGVICEVCDIEGVPSSALISAVSLIRPFTLLTVGRLAEVVPHAVKSLPGTGLRALSVECPADLDDQTFVRWAARTLRVAKRVAPSVMIYRVESEKRAGMLALLGATHVSLGGRDS